MDKKIKQPVSGKVAKVPIILQLEVLECGVAALAMVLAYYGKWIPLEQLRVDCGVSRDGSNAKNILMVARKYGMDVKGYRYELDALKKKGTFPCIIHWNFNHFVVLNGFKRDKAIISDPARGLVEVSMEEFDNSFTGVCIELSPSESFVADGEKKSMREFVKRRLRGHSVEFVITSVASFIMAIIALVNPQLSKIFMDNLMTGANQSWIIRFFLIMIFFAIIQIVLSGIYAFYSLKVEGKLAIKANAQYMWHVLRMPVEFFSQRMAGDIAERKKTNQTIAFSLIHTLAPTVFNVLMMIIYLVVILNYSVVLIMVSIGGMMINLLVNRYVSNKRINISKVHMRDKAKLSATTIAGIEMIETIKASGAENGFFEKWSGYQASVNTQNIKNIKLNYYYGLLIDIVTNIVNMGILAFGLYFIIRGKFTVGMLLAFQSMLTSFMKPVNELADARATIREMRTDMERIDDVLECPVDVQYEKKIDEVNKDDSSYVDNSEQINYEKLTGKVELKNVTFGYSRLAPPLIENFSMTIEPGQKIAFVGSSGCGKSTLSRLISGLYKPWSGEILFDGKNMKDIDRSVFTGSLAVVDQDITLFEDTISNNIKMWDSTIEDYEVILAARDASIHEDIMHREGGYEYKMLEGGKDFSGGQRQRMEIARVLAQDPTIIIMDEATSALDAKTEYEVVNAIKDRGITSIVIAHRLSTIRDCDEIIVLEQGKIVERGKHQELMANHGKYEELIMSE